MQKNDFRLSSEVVPEHYELFFDVDLNKFLFSGKETIQVFVREERSEIVLHALDLKISDAVLDFEGKESKIKFEEDKENERIILNLGRKVKGKLSLKFDFIGKLNDELAGFYRSKYKDEEGKDNYLATTQFEAPYARRAFPCFDEPDKKASFSVKLSLDSKFKALSNMPILNEKSENGKKIVEFEKSPKMSTYLLYMSVGDFEFIEQKLRDIVIRVVAVKGKVKQGKFALDLTRKFLDYFEKYSKVNYPLPKLDMIAIPDFAAGAMENWGAITFREILLLFDEKHTSTKVKKRIAEVIAHELWHQWSGNLVTMEWWNDLWLNESFATYMAYKAVDNYYPEWKIWEDFVSSSTAGALSDDSLQTTHSIEVEVKSPNEIEEIFDAISYGKGGSVLRMIDFYLGEENFRKGVSEYLKNFAYKNAKAVDLWNNLAKFSSSPIEMIMENWIKQKGYPLIEVHASGNSLSLSQRKFAKNSRNDKEIWKIPIVASFSGKEIKSVFDKKNMEMNYPGEKKWFKLNGGQRGFYRVKYEKDNLERLKELVSSGKLEVFDRYGLENDMFNLCLLGEVGLDEYLDFISCYSNEYSYLVLEDIYFHLRKIEGIFLEDERWDKIKNKFYNYLSKPFRNKFIHLSWNVKEGESQEDSLLRALCISYMGFIGEEKTIENCRKMFNDMLNGKKDIHPDLRGAIYGIISSFGDREEYDKMKKLYLDIENPEEKVRLLGSLARFKKKELIEDYLDFCLTDKVRVQNLRTVFPSVSSNPESRKVYFNWVKKNWGKLEKFKKTHFVFMELIESLIISYVGKDMKVKLKEFLESKNTGYHKTKANAFEILDINTDWLNNNKEALFSCFK